jgi:hypothetical protein
MVKQAVCELVEIHLVNGLTGGRILCPSEMIPSPGQYLLAHDPASDALLPVPIFQAGWIPHGFIIAPPIPEAWKPETRLSLRGPLGHGFDLPASARHVALVAVDGNPYRLLPLLELALTNKAAVTLLSYTVPASLPAEVEVQPVTVLPEAADWADYLAIDVVRESLPVLWKLIGEGEQVWTLKDAQGLVLTPVPCGGMAACGVCAVNTRRGWKMACKDGPVFRLRDLRG